MFPEKLKDISAERILKLAIKDLGDAIVEFHIFSSSMTLYMRAMRAWSAVNSNIELKTKIETKMQQKREISKQFGMPQTDEKGDIISRRYDPNKWMENVPDQYKDSGNEWILERSNSLLEFLGTFESQK